MDVLPHMEVLAVPMHASNDGMTSSLSESVGPAILLVYCVGGRHAYPFA